MDPIYEVSPMAATAAIAWIVVCACCLLALFHPRIDETVPECIALAFVAFFSAATAFRCLTVGYVTDAGMMLGLSVAFYATSIVSKHIQGGRHGRRIRN